MSDKSVKLSEYTEQELIELRNHIDYALNHIEERKRTECFQIYIKASGKKLRFKDRDNAIDYLKELIEKDRVFDYCTDMIILDFVYLDDTEIKYCEDYGK